MQKTVKVGAIVAMNPQRIIGVDGGLPWHYSEDLKRFKALTLNSIVIMGRKTWESIGSKPLPKRKNFVVSRSAGQKFDNAEHYTSLQEAVETARVIAAENQIEHVWIIGGAQIYQAALPWIDFFDITCVPDEIDESEYSSVARLTELSESEWQHSDWQQNADNDSLKHKTVSKVSS